MGFILSGVSTKWHFGHAMLQANANNKDASERASRLLTSAHVINCDAKSQIVEFSFIRPEGRDVWGGTSLAFGRTFIRLQVTDALSSDVDCGFDTAAIALLYKVELLRRGDLEPAEVRHLMSTVAKIPVLSVEPHEPTGIDRCGPHVWSVIFHSTGCPRAISTMRNLRFTVGDKVEDVHIHHPRAARRHPCSMCLSTTHSKKECKSTEPDKAAMKHTVTVAIQDHVAPPVLKIARTAKAFWRNFKTIRKAVAPQLATRL